MLVDAHAHLDRYGEELSAAVQEIIEKRILTIAVSMDVDSFTRNLSIGRRSELILPTFGLHPWNAPRYADKLEQLQQPIADSPMIGEIGLDFHFVKDESLYRAQRLAFETLLRQAAEQDKIVNLHTKGAEEEVLGLLEKHGIRRAIVHWYSGPLDILEDYIERGLYLTVGVDVMYSEHIKAIVRKIPVQRLLTETDNPGAYRWLQGKPGMPHLVEKVVATVAAIRGIQPAKLEQQVVENLKRLAADDDWAVVLFNG
jgi:TatD DNase family protein